MEVWRKNTGTRSIVCCLCRSCKAACTERLWNYSNGVDFHYYCRCFCIERLCNGVDSKKDSDATDFSTMFYCSLAASIFIYVIVYAMAPFIASFYREPILKNVLRVFALRIPLSVYNTIQHAYVSRHMLLSASSFNLIWNAFLWHCGYCDGVHGGWCLGTGRSIFYKYNYRYVCFSNHCSVAPATSFSWEAAKS